ncbi:MAG TPA: DUF1573 domain-containing protein [Verrucomicrobiales bacterium]|nr:DUF1573 domain-containing protein [Verrucomicrobiales bacterium]
MSRHPPRQKPASRPVPASKPATTLLGILLLAAATAVSAFLAWHSWKGTAVPGCSEQAACHSIIGGRWGQVLGAPVSFPGTLLYGALAFLGIWSLRPGPDVHHRFRIAGFVAVAGGALWFTFVQAVLLRAFCPWCCTVHALAVAGALLLLRKPAATPGRKAPAAPKAAPSPRRLLRPEILVPLAAVAAVALLQTAILPPEKIIASELAEKGLVRTQSQLSLYEGSIQFDPADFPVIGSPDAAVLGVVLADFTCPHCRELHRLLEELTAESPDGAGFVFVPAYRDPEAAAVHRILITTWKEDPTFYKELTGAFLAEVAEPAPESLLQQVQTRFAGRFYELAWNQAPSIDSALQLGQRLLAANDASLTAASLPQLMIGSTVLAGEPSLTTIRNLIAEASASGLQGPALAPLADSQASEAPPVAAAQVAQPRIEFVTTHLELPETPRGEVARGAFRYRNTGNAPLLITQIKPACGCTAVAGWEEPVPPGGEGSFTVQLDTSRFTGTVTKSIDVMSNAVNTSAGVSPVKVTAQIWQPVRLNPSSIHFGTLLKGRPIEPKTIDITVTDADPIDLGTPRILHPAFTAQLEPVTPGRKYTLTVSFTPTDGQPVTQTQLILPLNHPRLAQLTLPIYARVANAVEAVPAEVIFPPVPRNQPHERILTVQCHDRTHEGFTVTGLDIAGAKDVSAELQSLPFPNTTHVRIKITFPAGFDPASAENAGAALVVRTNHPEAETVQVPFKPYTQRPLPAPSRRPGP